MFVYCNVEPLGDKTQDCVIRAITLALGINYNDVVNLLYENGLENDCDCLNVECYDNLLSDYFNLPRIHIEGMSVDEIANKFRNNVLIVRTRGHLSTCMFGNIFDIFDCGSYIVTDMWIVR